MKKLISIILTLAFIISLLAGCAATAPEAETGDTAAETVTEDKNENETEAEAQAKPAVRIAGLKGATSIGMVKLLDDDERGAARNDYEYTLAGTADEITPKFIKGELDIIAVPVNLAAVLYGKTGGGVEMLAVNTLGVTYIVENGNKVHDWRDLKGKTVYATGKNAVPEYALRYLLAQNGLDPDKDVKIEWKSEPTEIVAMMTADSDIIAMLPQPYVTAARGQVEELRVALDMTESWDALEKDSRLITAGVIVRREFAEQHPDAIANFLADYRASTKFVNAEPTAAAALVEKYGIIKAAVAEKAIPECNIVCITNDEMKTALEGFLKVVYDMEAKAVGGELPKDDFYYAE